MISLDMQAVDLCNINKDAFLKKVVSIFTFKKKFYLENFASEIR